MQSSKSQTLSRLKLQKYFLLFTFFSVKSSLSNQVSLIIKGCVKLLLIVPIYLLGKFSKQKQIHKSNFSIFFQIQKHQRKLALTVSQIPLMLKNLLYALSGVAIFLSITQMRIPPLNLILRQVSTIMAKEVTVEPYSMAFVTAPNKDVAKTLAGGLGKYFSISQLFLFFENYNLELK